MDHRTTSPATTVARLLADRTRTEGDRPLVTWYDDHTGARTELSYATLDNWASKLANLLVEEFALAPGDHLAVDLDGHWTAAAAALAAWKVGAAVRYGGAADDALVTCCHERHVSRNRDRPALVVGDGLAGEPLSDPALGDEHLVLADEVHAYADDYDGSDVTPQTSAVTTDGATLDHAELLARADDRRTALGDDADRIGVLVPLDHPAAAELLVVALLGGAGLVCARTDDHRPRWERLRSERVTVVTGPASLLGSDGGAHPIRVVPLDRQR